MRKPYSQDLRDRVIDTVIKGGMSRRAAAIHYHVSPSAAVKQLQAYTQEGRRTVSGRCGHRPLKRASERQWLLLQREESPDLTLEPYP